MSFRLISSPSVCVFSFCMFALYRINIYLKPLEPEPNVDRPTPVLSLSKRPDMVGHKIRHPQAETAVNHSHRILSFALQSPPTFGWRTFCNCRNTCCAVMACWHGGIPPGISSLGQSRLKQGEQ